MLETLESKRKEKMRKPKWLKVKLPTGEAFKKVREIVDEHHLHTMCESGSCPNMGECWGAGTVTFMILDPICTPSCGFCAVETGPPDAVDEFESGRVGQSLKIKEVTHCVITSVDRDDLPDGGSIIWSQTVRAIRRQAPGISIESLIPDFAGKWQNFEPIIDVAPEMVGHNLETVSSLTPQVRIQTKYDRNHEVLRRLKNGGMHTKSGLMLGLGESRREVIEAMDGLRSVGADVLTLGQYLQPTRKHLPVEEFVTPEQFAEYREVGLDKGFRFVESGPLVRSSYYAEKHLF